MLQADAKREALREAGLMRDSALSMRAYTSEEIVPLLHEGMKSEFLPQSVPSYATTQNFLKLREHHPEYAYRAATLNPTNLRDRAVDWEADIVQQFRNDPAMPEIGGERAHAHGALEYLLSSQHCLDGFPAPREAHYELLCAHVAGRLGKGELPVAVPAPAAPAPRPAAAPAATAAFSAARLASLERQLAHHIGPLARHLVRRAAAEAHDWEQLLGRLAREIDSDAARQQFLSAARALSRPTP